MNRRERGFTLVELGIVLSCAAIVVPMAYMFWRGIEARDLEIRAQQAFTASARTLSEELRRDQRTSSLTVGFAFPGDAACGSVQYKRGDDGVVVRSTATCGDRFVARDVERLEVGLGSVSVHFSKDVGGRSPARATYTIGLPGVIAW